MKQELSKEKIMELLTSFVRGDFAEENNEYIVTIESRDFDKPIIFRVDVAKIEELSRRLAGLSINNETALYNDTEYEIIVREESPLITRRIRDDYIKVKDDENGFIYDLSPASNEYLIWLLNEMQKNTSSRGFNLLSPSRIRINKKYLEEKEENACIFDFIRLFHFRFLTLKVTSENKASLSGFSKQVYAFLFQVGYNFDTALIPVRFLEEITRKSRITRMKRSQSFEEIEFPRRTYNEDIVQRYLLAVSTDNPVIEYLSYYHVIEHFYEIVFNEDLTERVKKKITEPDFSYKNDKNIRQLIKTIKKFHDTRSGKMNVDEKKALNLCLHKYILLEELRTKLLEYDENILEYYKTTKVNFSDGNIVDINNNDDGTVFKALTERIYNTRNALVHSKDGDKLKYTPFRDDKVLVREIPLMRFICEIVILETSTI